jgi:hypothetical protein
MLLRLLGRLVWGTTKFTVKHVVVPIAISVAAAAAIAAVSERIRDGTPAPNGHVSPLVEAGFEAEE